MSRLVVPILTVIMFASLVPVIYPSLESLTWLCAFFILGAVMLSPVAICVDAEDRKPVVIALVIFLILGGMLEVMIIQRLH